MNKNFLYLKEYIENNLDLNTNIIKSTLFEYFNKKYLDDLPLLNLIDFFKIKNIDNDLLENKLYNTIDFNNIGNFNNDINFKGHKICFFNGRLIYTDINKDIIKIDMIEENNKDMSFFYSDNFLKNVNIFYFLNHFLSKNVYNINIISSCKNNNLEVFHFFSNKNEYLYNFKYFITLQKNIKFNIIEYNNILDNKIHINFSKNILLKNNTELNYYFYGKSSIDSANFFNFNIEQKDYSKLKYNYFCLDNFNIKNNINFFQYGYNSYVKTNVLKCLKSNVFDSTDLNVYHKNRNTTSETNYRVITYDNSFCNFKGNIDVNKDVIDIDAKLNCKGILMSNSSYISLIPELSIRNGNIKCFHGATIGFLNKEIIFYLMTRGLSRKDSEFIILNSFFNELIDKENYISKILYKLIVKDFLLC
jgi:Fe-S cluster assembly protein SufD